MPGSGKMPLVREQKDRRKSRNNSSIGLKKCRNGVYKATNYQLHLWCSDVVPHCLVSYLEFHLSLYSPGIILALKTLRQLVNFYSNIEYITKLYL